MGKGADKGKSEWVRVRPRRRIVAGGFSLPPFLEIFVVSNTGFVTLPPMIALG